MGDPGFVRHLMVLHLMIRMPDAVQTTAIRCGTMWQRL